MRRPSVLGSVLLAGLALLASGCADSRPGGKVVSPVPGNKLVIVKAPTGNPTAGKAVFTAQGCSGCHTFTPAGAKGTVGPDLDKLAQYAQVANQGTEQAFVSTSITDPGAYVQPGYKNGIMPLTYSSLSAQQVADLVAFLTQK